MSRIGVSPEEAIHLRTWAQDHKNPKRALRAKIILMLHEDYTRGDISIKLGTTVGVVRKIEHRFKLHRISGIEEDAPRPRRPITVSMDSIEEIAYTLYYEKPPKDKTRWSLRDLASHVGLPPTTTYRVISNLNISFSKYNDDHQNNISNHQSEREDKVVITTDTHEFPPTTQISDILGLFLCPRINAVVYHLEPDGKPRTDRKEPTPLNLSMERISTLYERRSEELMILIKRNHDLTYKIGLNWYDELDFLIFLRTIYNKIDRKDDILILITSENFDGLDKTNKWLGHNRRYKVMAYNYDLWNNAVYNEIMSVRSHNKRWILYQLEQFISDLNGWGIEPGKRPDPFLSILRLTNKNYIA